MTAIEHRVEAERIVNPDYSGKTYSDDDFRLGLNAAQTTFGAVAKLAGAKLAK